ncbi:MAG: metallophosphoesterase, partial [Pseudomonadota bacterium]
MRVLFLADTHLGFDDPLHTRVERRRRGPEFYDNFRRALQPARNGEVDVVIHGGDIFFRSKVRPDVVQEALGIIAEVTDRGVPFVLVPGNHER